MSRRLKRNEQLAMQTQLKWRGGLLLVSMLVIALGLGWRAASLQVLDNAFLASQGDARHLRTVRIAAHRGSIVDRNGEPLAVSTPVDSIWANPKELAAVPARIDELARAIGKNPQWVTRKVSSNTEREFIYLRRHMRPDDSARVIALNVPGVYSLREYRRYYPAGEVAAHVIGFTNIDDVGQEGLELAYDNWMMGAPGSKRIMKDRLGRTIENVESVNPARAGKTLVASIDLRLQYLAYRELKRAVEKHDARSGMVVLLDIESGEVLAMANQPSYNPNDRAQYSVDRYRNRAVTDIFEPGSSLKTFTLGAAIESGHFEPHSRIDTRPGYFKVGKKLIEDKKNLGIVDMTTILSRSSNVGVSKIALELKPRELWSVLASLGLGRLTASGFPGESAGLLNHHEYWRPIGQATLAYGYGVSVTALQLTQAYAAIGSGGLRRPVTFVRTDERTESERVLAKGTALALTGMLEAAVAPDGTGERAGVHGYRVAGKTGTAYKYEAGGYSDDRYNAVFAGFAPASDPRLALVVVIDEPEGEEHQGGDVAAPVFARIASGALRILDVAPDDLVPEPATAIQTVLAR